MLADTIRSARRTRGRSQVALARESGVPQRTISQLENGRATVTTRTADALLDALGLSLVAVPLRGVTAFDTARWIRNGLVHGRAEDARRWLIQLNDDLGRAAADRDVASLVLETAAEPEPTGDAYFDAALAGIAEAQLQRAGVPAHNWIRQARRYAPLSLDSLGYRWALEHQDDTDPVLLEHGVILPNETLQSR